MRWPALCSVALFACSLGLLACTPEIGDDCNGNADCGSGRVCDRSMPGGYCTSSPCDVNGCPEEAVCIEFFDGSSWCMRHCDDNGDCRGGYRCEKGTGDYKFCNAK